MEYKYCTLSIVMLVATLVSHQCIASREMFANTLSHYSAQSLAMASHAARTVSTKAVQLGNALVSAMVAHPRLTCLCIAAVLLTCRRARDPLIHLGSYGVRKTAAFVRMSIIERIKALLFTDVNARLDKTNLVLINHTNRLDFIATGVQNLRDQMDVVNVQLRTMGIDLSAVKTNTEKLKCIEESLARLDSHSDKAFALLTELQGQVRALQQAIAKFDGSNATIEQIKKNQEQMMKLFGDQLQAIYMCLNMQNNRTGAGK